MATSSKPAQYDLNGEAKPTPPPDPEIIPPGARNQKRGASAKSPLPDPETTLGSQRPAGKTGPKSRSEQIGGLAEQIFGLHQLASMMTGLQSLLITDKQAVALAGPVIDCAKKWNIPLSVEGWPELQLLATAAAIYVPLAATLQMEIAARRAKSAHPEDQPGDPSAPQSGPDASVMPFPGTPHGPVQ